MNENVFEVGVNLKSQNYTDCKAKFGSQTIFWMEKSLFQYSITSLKLPSHRIVHIVEGSWMKQEDPTDFATTSPIK